MGKGAVGLVAGYWPEDVYRYLAVPSMYLDEALVMRPAKRFAEKVAIECGSVRMTYQRLAAETDRMSKAVLFLTEGRNLRVALLAHDPPQFLPILMGVLRAHCLVLLPDVSGPGATLQQQIAEFGPDLVITDEKTDNLAPILPEKVRVVSVAELSQTAETTAKVQKRLDMKAPCIAIAGSKGHICYHSHMSVLAGAMSWSAFLPLKEEDSVLNVQPLHTWQGLCSLLPVLFRGATCIFGSVEDPERTATSVMAHHCTYTLFSQEQARTLFEPSHSSLVDALSQYLAGFFVSVPGHFRARSRKQMRNWLGDVPVLTVFGFPEAGPVLASHPTWYLNDALGIPVSNVDLWPINPKTGNPLLVPWEAIEYAEVGIKSPMMAVQFLSSETKEAEVRDGWLRSHLVVTMDPNGLFYPRPEFATRPEEAAHARA